MKWQLGESREISLRRGLWAVAQNLKAKYTAPTMNA